MKAVRLEIIEGPSSMLASLLAQGKLEIAVLFDNTITASLSMRPVLSEPLFFVAPPGSLGGREAVTLPETAVYPLLLMSRPNGLREMVESQYVATGIRPDVRAEINAPGLLLEEIKAGVGYSVLPACGLDGPIRKREIDAAQLTDEGLQRTICLCTSRMFIRTRAAEHVQELLREAMLAAVRDGRWRATLAAE